MTATVKDLLDAIHLRAWDLSAVLAVPPASESSVDRSEALLRAWPGLAASALRALDAVPFVAVRASDVAPLRGSLTEIAARGHRWRGSAAGAGPHPDVVGIMTRYGVLADLLAGQLPVSTAVDVSAALGLQANILAPVHAAAVATLGVLDGREPTGDARFLLQRLAARTEPFALVPVGDRRGRFEDVGVVAAGDQSFDAAIADWVRVTGRKLGSRHDVTGYALQAAAGDIVILSAAAATTVRAGVTLGLVDPEQGSSAVKALAASHAAWREPTRWPASVRLDGARSPEQAAASRFLRGLITDTMRHGQDWLPAQALHDRLDVTVLLGSMRRGMHAAGNVALVHYQAVENVVRGQGQLWVAASTLNDPAIYGPDMVRAALRKRWVPMPRHEPVGEAILGAAKHALTTTTVALGELDRTAATPASEVRSRRTSLGLDQGRIVAHAPSVAATYETIKPSVSMGVQAQRKTPAVSPGRVVRGPWR